VIRSQHGTAQHLDRRPPGAGSSGVACAQLLASLTEWMLDLAGVGVGHRVSLTWPLAQGSRRSQRHGVSA
jgi:hypothetical protein